MNNRPLVTRSSSEIIALVQSGPRNEWPRRARLYHYLNNYMEEHGMWHLKFWPAFHIRNILNRHKSHDQRTTLFFFLTFNGLDPKFAGDAIMVEDVFNQIPVENWYDAKAQYDLFKSMSTKAIMGTLWNNIPVYDISEGRLITKT